MIKTLVTGIAFCFLLLSCNNSEKVDYFEGILIYKTDDPMLNHVPVDSGKFVKYYVKGDSIRVESFTPMGKQIHLRNHTSKSGVLIFVHGGRKVALLQDFKKDTIQRGFKLNNINEPGEVLGLETEMTQISGAYLKQPLKITYSPNYPNHIIDIYDRIVPGLPVKYSLMVQQFKVNYELVQIKQEPVEDQKFSIPKDCIVLTMEEFMQQLSNQEVNP